MRAKIGVAERHGFTRWVKRAFFARSFSKDARGHREMCRPAADAVRTIHPGISLSPPASLAGTNAEPRAEKRGTSSRDNARRRSVGRTGRSRAPGRTHRRAGIHFFDSSSRLFFRNGVKRSIGTGRKVVVLCSLEISRIVWRKRSWSAMGWALIIPAACTSFSAA